MDHLAIQDVYATEVRGQEEKVKAAQEAIPTAVKFLSYIFKIVQA